MISAAYVTGGNLKESAEIEVILLLIRFKPMYDAEEEKLKLPGVMVVI